MERETRRELTKLAIGIAVGIPLLLRVAAAEPFGEWTTPIIACCLPPIGLVGMLVEDALRRL